MNVAKRLIVPLAILGLVIAAGFAMFTTDKTKTVTAHFPRTISIYEGSPVKVLGVPVGAVDKVTPSGTDVVVEMHYDKNVDIPADAQAVIVSPSIVGDRYIQLTPVYESGPKLADGAVLQDQDTAVPLELDQIYSSLDELNVALGPNGANKNGSLNRLLAVGAKNLKGTGGDFRSTVRDMADAAAALSSDSGDTADSIRNLNKFTTALAKSNNQYVSFSRDMTAVAGQLNGERGELRAVIRTLGPTLRNVNRFVKDNKKAISTSVTGLGKLSDVVARNKNGLAAFLDSAPTGIENAALTYDPISGTLMSRINLQQSDNLALWLCSLAYSLGAPSSQCETLLKPINFLGGPISKILTIDPSFITKLTTTYDVKQPPPDAYGPGQSPAKTPKSRQQNRGMPASDDPTLGGVVNPR
jgi:virulence factor Mce-like protein